MRADLHSLSTEMRASRALRRSGRLGAPTAETIRALSPPMCGRGASATPATRASTGKRIRPATAGSAPRPAGPAPTKKVKAAVGRTIEQGLWRRGFARVAGERATHVFGVGNGRDERGAWPPRH